MTNEKTREIGGQALQDADEPSRPLTVEEALDIAIHLQQVDRLAEASAVYGEILKAAPEHPRALHYAGVLAHQLGKSEDAAALIRRSLALGGHQAGWHNNLGKVLQEAGRLDEAIEAYRSAIAIDPEHVDAYSNLGVLLRATGRPDEAEASYRTAIRLNPSYPDAYVNLGILLNGVRRTEEAAECFCRAITLRPKHPEARRLLALAHCNLGEVDEAVRIFEEWLAEEPDDPIARHMLAACTGQTMPLRASDDYVALTFDSFAASFESKLAKLSYRAPRLVAAMLEDSGLQPAKALDVLDAGCGTGLCGPLVAPYARRLVGVDLSAGMLKQASAKQVYDELLQQELTATLSARAASLDLVISADTLVYFGPLEEVVAAASRALRSGGLFIFTLERGMEPSPQDFRLELHGRYTHSEPYVANLLRSHGFDVDIEHADLRLESGRPVAGLVVRARKRPDAR
jgi:predicted TPR repeat methyltransferase